MTLTYEKIRRAREILLKAQVEKLTPIDLADRESLDRLFSAPPGGPVVGAGGACGAGGGSTKPR